MPDIHIMEYTPDPDEQIQVIPIVRDNALWYQFIDTESGQTFIVNYMTALRMARRISFLTGRTHQLMLEAETDGYGPAEWEGITRAMDNPKDEDWQRELYRRPKN